MKKRKCTIYHLNGNNKVAQSIIKSNKLQIDQIYDDDVIMGMFKIWKSENLNDNLTMENATNPNNMEWFGVTCNSEVVGFFALESRLKLLAIIYVAKEKRHQGFAKKIVEKSNCSAIQLGFYDQESLKKTKDAFKDLGYTEHRVLVYSNPLVRMAVGEVLSKPERSKRTFIPGLEYISSEDKNLVRI